MARARIVDNLLEVHALSVAHRERRANKKSRVRNTGRGFEAKLTG
jgi:hypothetical protein